MDQRQGSEQTNIAVEVGTHCVGSPPSFHSETQNLYFFLEQLQDFKELRGIENMSSRSQRQNPIGRSNTSDLY